MAVDREAMKRKYFAEIAPKYAEITGNSTRDIFAKLLEQEDLGIDGESVIHDNGAGPGTATEALIPWCSRRQISPKIIATDYSPEMIQALKVIKKNSASWENVEAKVIDSSDLSIYAEGTFTHSICNFSLPTFTAPSLCLREIHRTLAPSGLTIQTAWKRFAASEVIAAAQDIVKGQGWSKAHPLPVNGPEFFDEGYMAHLMVDSGLEKSKMKVLTMSIKITEGADWDGLYDLMTNSSLAMAVKRGWEEAEAAIWLEAVEQAMQKEKADFGGVWFEAWVVIARK